MANGFRFPKFLPVRKRCWIPLSVRSLFFRNDGITGERFADTVARLGFEYVEDQLLHSEINRTEILAKTVKGGASC